MRQGLLVVALCALPMGTMAQTWIPGDSYIIGNTLIPGAPVLLASGKGHRGGGAPSPSPSPSPAGATFSSGSSGESSFTFQYQAQSAPPPTGGTLPAQPVELPPIVSVQPLPPSTLPAPHATLTIPVQVMFQRPGIVGRRPVSPEQLPVIPPGGTCPTGCVPTVPEAEPKAVPQSYYYQPVPEQMLQPLYAPARRICNALGQCIPWP